MLLTEYDEKKHYRALFRDGWERGREEHLWEQIRKKLEKGKTVTEIADELEEEVSVIQWLIDNPASEIPDYLKDYMSDPYEEAEAQVQKKRGWRRK